MKQAEWTQKALAALESAGLVKTGFVNIRYADGGGYAMEVADLDNEVYNITVRQAS